MLLGGFTLLQRSQIIKMKRKGQEEMVGFVLIMLVVAVIFLVFLGIYLGKNDSPQPVESEEISDFLGAIFQYTTDCASSDPSNPLKIRVLIRECYEGEICLDGRDSCRVLQNNLRNLVESSWNFRNNSQEQGYQLSIVRETETGEKTIFPDYLQPVIYNGSISTRVRAAEVVLDDGIIMRLEIYSSSS